MVKQHYCHDCRFRLEDMCRYGGKTSRSPTGVACDWWKQAFCVCCHFFERDPANEYKGTCLLPDQPEEVRSVGSFDSGCRSYVYEKKEFKKFGQNKKVDHA